MNCESVVCQYDMINLYLYKEILIYASTTNSISIRNNIFYWLSDRSFRHNDKYFLEQIHFCNSIYSQIYKNKIQYVLKMSEDIIDLSIYNYSSRNSDYRNIPVKWITRIL